MPPKLKKELYTPQSLRRNYKRPRSSLLFEMDKGELFIEFSGSERDWKLRGILLSALTSRPQPVAESVSSESYSEESTHPPPARAEESQEDETGEDDEEVIVPEAIARLGGNIKEFCGW